VSKKARCAVQVSRDPSFRDRADVSAKLLRFDKDLSMQTSRVALFSALLLINLGVLQVAAQAAAAPKPVVKGGVSQPVEKEISLPVRQVSLYNNGVGFFEQAGMVSGNELVRIDFTTAQLNDVLQSLTAVDLGDGHVVGAGYNTSAPLATQLNSLAPGLGQDPTVLDFLHALKGSRVEVRTGAGVFSGRLLNVEVRTEPEGKGSAVRVERRYVTVISDAGGMRTFELTPSVEVRMVGGENREIGRYLQLLAAGHDSGLRHLTLEDRGTGERELHISYLSALPAWKSSYRILLSNGNTPGGAQTATLQGWAVIDNTSGVDWDNVQLTLVSGAPQSFIQQIARPLDVQRQQLPMPISGVRTKTPYSGGVIGAMADPIQGGEAASVPMSASSIGGGMGMEVHRTQQAAVAPAMQPVSLTGDYERAADKTLAPQTTSADLDNLFEYKLSKPITIRMGESTTVPILQTEIAAKRVTVWNPRTNPGALMRSLWLTNTSNLTLAAGSFSILENGVFGGQGQMNLIHPKERRIVPYAVDDAVSVEFAEGKRLSPAASRIVIFNGTLSVHRLYPRVREYTIHNTGSSARTVVLEPERTDKFQLLSGKPRIASVWDLGPDMPAPAEVLDKSYRFEVEVGPSSTATFKLVETHSHPQHYEIATMHEDELQGIIEEAKGDPGALAKLQPLLDAKHQLHEVDKQLRAAQSAMDAVKFEEKRIRENMASLNGNSGEQSLSKRYADEMNQQEDKMESLHKQKDALLQQQDAIQRQLADKVATLQGSTTLRTTGA